MKRIVILLAVIGFTSVAYGQSKTTQALHKKYNRALSLFFYNNTLRMINQSGDKDFDDRIKDIEKMKFLTLEKDASFSNEEYKKLVAGYKTEAYEEIMTSRYQGKNFDVFLKEKSGKTQGMVILVNDSTSLYVFDIVGSIALDKVTSLYSTMAQSAEVGKLINDLTNLRDRRNEYEDK